MSPEGKIRSSGARSRARRADAEHNRAALLSAARRLFDERGPDAPLDEIARRAGVANATLYRHFASRAELILAVYSSEVTELAGLADRLLEAPDPDRALTDWLRAFVSHVSTKRELALALPDGPGDQRGALFADWHATMGTAAERLLDRARAMGTVRSGVEAGDLLALATGIATTRLSDDRLDAVLAIVRSGYIADGPAH
jgi:AcrR family transcriptional regulator